MVRSYDKRKILYSDNSHTLLKVLSRDNENILVGSMEIIEDRNKNPIVIIESISRKFNR